MATTNNYTAIMALGWDKVYYHDGKGKVKLTENGKTPTLFIRNYTVGDDTLTVYFTQAYAFVVCNSDITTEDVLKAFEDGLLELEDSTYSEIDGFTPVSYYDYEEDCLIAYAASNCKMTDEITDDVRFRMDTIFNTFFTVMTVGDDE